MLHLRKYLRKSDSEKLWSMLVKCSYPFFPIKHTHDLISWMISSSFPLWSVDRDVTDNSCCFLPGQSDRQWDGSGIWGIWEDRKPSQKRRWIQVLLKPSHWGLPAAKCSETRRQLLISPHRLHCLELSAVGPEPEKSMYSLMRGKTQEEQTSLLFSRV